MIRTACASDMGSGAAMAARKCGHSARQPQANRRLRKQRNGFPKKLNSCSVKFRNRRKASLNLIRTPQESSHAHFRKLSRKNWHSVCKKTPSGYVRDTASETSAWKTD